jgi:hypothetical protein
LINYLQSIYEKKTHVAKARLGGSDGLRLTRAAFSNLVKFNSLTEQFTQLVDEVDMQWMEL